MVICGRTCLAAFLACAFLLGFTAESYPSYNTEAGRKYSVACERLADLKKSPKKKKYRSYWMDCARTFELVEKKYPSSPAAGDACFERAGLYLDMYQVTKYGRDLSESVQAYEKCQTVYPRHARAPEALYHIIALSLDYKKDNVAATKIYTKLSSTYPDSSWTGKAKARLGLNTAVRKKVKKEPESRKTPLPIIAAPQSLKDLGVVKSIRHWSGGAYTRIVIDQDKAVKFQAQELKNPDRLVFDLLNARVDDSVDKDPMPVNDGILKQVRASQFEPGTVRVVLDLASIKSYMAFPLHDPERLVIDVTGENSETAAESRPATSQTGTLPKEEPRKQEQPALSKSESNDKQGGEKLSLSRQLGLKIKTIAIDAGHGGHDPGALGRGGLKEKDITLDIARRLAALVREKLNCNVIMTRDRDEFIQLEDRPAIAKTRGADLFVSIHVNANKKRKARGIETYIQSLTASDRDAMATAARENSMTTKKLSQLKSELDRIFADLTRDDKLEESLKLAHSVQGSLVETMKPVQKHEVNLGVKRAFFYVLINTEMPSILAECGFISNPDEEKLLRRESYRQGLAEALFQGVKKYVDARTPQIAGR